MHPAYSVILFTTASGAGYGLLAWLALAGMLGSYGIATHRIAFAVPLVFCVVGTLVSIALFHQTLTQVVTAVAAGNAVTAAAVAVTIGAQAALGERKANAA